MPQLPWMEWAENEIGQHEIAGPGSNPRILEYRRIASLSEIKGDDSDVPWCKIFVNAAFVESGLPIRKNAMALSIKSDPDFIRLSGPAYGAVAAFWRGTPKAGTGHIGFYCGETANAGRILVLGGNESDAVRKAFFPASSIRFGLVGYYWPKSVEAPRLAKVVVNDDGHPAIVSAV